MFVPYDQLSDQIGPLCREDLRTIGIVLVENPWKAARRPYHKQKLALILAYLRHFALEQPARGVAVEHLVAASGPYRVALEEAAKRLGPLRMMRPAEFELRTDLEPLVASGAIEELPHESWITTRQQFRGSHPNGAPYLLERFYRFVRRQTGVLMRKGQPVGGQFNFDKENRSPYHGDSPTTAPPTFPCSSIKQEVADLIAGRYAAHPGTLDLDHLPVTREDAEQHWAWAKLHALPLFGKYEDAMASNSSTLFHTRISALLNIYRLLPMRIVQEAEELDIPIASKEGFIRQVLGWREFMHHVHEETNGFRTLPGSEPPVASAPGEGGYSHWAGRPWSSVISGDDPDGGVLISALHVDTPLPPAFWGRTSGLNCLDQGERAGASHHKVDDSLELRNSVRSLPARAYRLVLGRLHRCL